MKSKALNVTALGFLGLFLVSCTADIRTDYVRETKKTQASESKARQILAEVAQAHGVDALEKQPGYQFTAVDHWQGLLATGGVLWPQRKSKLAFKYATGTFDAQVEFLDGDRKGLVAGLQSWNYYEKEAGQNLEFKDEHNDRYVFGMAAFQYFTELPGRLKNAPIARYAGTREFKGVNYELVFVTWGSVAANDKHDQYLVYVHPKTKIVEYAIFTIRDNYLPLPGTAFMYGSIGYKDYRDVDGYKVAYTQNLFAFDPDEDDDDYLHRLTLEFFEFGGFELAELYPKKGLEKLGDSKN